MKDALNDTELVIAGPNAPETATCPECGGEVVLRCRRNGQQTPTWLYRHRQGVETDCLRRVNPLER